LVDDTARENFAKYGNPDGPGNFQVGIALPKNVDDIEHQIVILSTFMIIIIFIIPGFFYTQLFKEERDHGGVSMKNRKYFYDMIDDRMAGKKIPGLLAQGEEFVKMKVRSKEEL
jgi:translocation protein SEC63